MTEQETAVLNAFRRAGNYASEGQIADMTDYPKPSVRRAIQQLIRKGVNLSYADKGIYRLREETKTVPASEMCAMPERRADWPDWRREPRTDADRRV